MGSKVELPVVLFITILVYQGRGWGWFGGVVVQPCPEIMDTPSPLKKKSSQDTYEYFTSRFHDVLVPGTSEE